MDVLGANRFRPVVCLESELFDNLIGAGEQRRWNLEGACF